MKNRIGSLGVMGVAAWALAQAAAAQEFPANRCFVGQDGKVSFTGATGAFSEALVMDRTVRALAFGPDGLLYVADFEGSMIAAYDAAGKLMKSWPAPEPFLPVGLAFGPNGHLYASNEALGRVVEFDTSGAVVREFLGEGQGSPYAIAVGPDGHLFVAFAGAPGIMEFDPSGTKVADSESYSYVAIAFGPEGNLHALAWDGSLSEFDTTGALDTTIQLTQSGCLGMAFGPNGNLYVVRQETVLEFDAENQLVGSLPTAGVPLAIAFSPQRFRTVVRGSVVGADGSIAKAVEKDAVLSLAPGSRTVALWFQDDPIDTLDVASRLGASALVLHGFDGPESGTPKGRMFHGASVGTPAQADGVGSIVLTAKGKVDALGAFSIGTASGTVHWATPEAVLSAQVKTTKRLN